MRYKDYYAALALARDADAEAVKKAYRKLAQQHHPDVSADPGAEARFKEVLEAYATLRDPQRRAAYDALGRHRGGDEFRPTAQWEAAWGGDGAYADLDLADLLEAVVRERGGRSTKRTVPLRGRDYEASLVLPLEDAHRGVTVNVDFTHENGSRTLAVTVPPGVVDGQRLRLRGKGGPGRHGGSAGDIYLHIALEPHPTFRSDGHDLVFDLPLTPWEAVLGRDVEVATLDGPVLLAVPAGTQSGRKLRLRGRGLANGQDGRGDLYAVVRIEVPASLTPRERKLFEKLARESRFDPRATVSKEAAHGD